MASEKSIEIIRQLIEFDTTSRESNLDLINFIKEYLSTFGIESKIITNETGKKANLYATIGDQNTPGIMLSGHTDVVPVDGQSWKTSPFELVKDQNRYFGRNTTGIMIRAILGSGNVSYGPKNFICTPKDLIRS